MTPADGPTGGERPRGSGSGGRDGAAPGAAAAPRRGPVDRARLDAVFGETLPETTLDEAREPGAGIGDDWWREQRPPHHG